MTDRLYRETARRLTTSTNIGASALAVLIIIGSATSWTRFGTAVAFHLLIIPFNIAFGALVVPRYGARAEVVRSAINGVLCGFGYSLIGWPLAVWFWLPFGAISFDQFGGRHTLVNLIVLCVLQDAAALIHGVDWVYPLSFTVFAGAVFSISGSRLAVIREMLVSAEAQREELARTEIELRQAQKLEAIGRLASGVAHEINTPIQFIGDSIRFVREGVADLETADADDRAYLAEEIPQALARAAEGCERVATIVRSMRQFAHTQDTVAAVDLNAAIEATLEISRHEYKLVADVEKHFAKLPPVTCNGGEINQVLVNLITNAAHAIGDATDGHRGTITLSTQIGPEGVTIVVADDGPGIPVSVRDRIFDPFFTTKSVGRGTGQGLAISRAIVERHGGKLTFESDVGVGTRFSIRLPVGYATDEHGGHLGMHRLRSAAA